MDCRQTLDACDGGLALLSYGTRGVSCCKAAMSFSLQEAFARACAAGDLEKAKPWALADVVNPREPTVFQRVCKNGHLEVAKWLHRLGNTHLQTDTDDGSLFHIACEQGHLELAKWMFSTGEVKSQDDEGAAFAMACAAGHADVAMWLLTVHCWRPPDYDWTFNTTTMDGQLHVLNVFCASGPAAGVHPPYPRRRHRQSWNVVCNREFTGSVLGLSSIARCAQSPVGRGCCERTCRRSGPSVCGAETPPVRRLNLHSARVS